MGYKTHIGKIKSRTGVTHNDEADTSARNVVEGHKIPDITFTDAEPPVGGLRTWPQIRKTNKDSTSIIIKLVDLHSNFTQTHPNTHTKPHDKSWHHLQSNPT